MRTTALLAAALILIASAAEIHSAEFNVRDYGAKGDDVTDDTPAIQAAVDAASAHGGGTVFFPNGAYLLDSYHPSPHPWYFYNVLIPSNVTLDADPGTTIVQGSAGRAPLQVGATEVATSMLVFGTHNYVSNTFQDPAMNGGFHALSAMVANSPVVTLANAADSALFAPGDYVAMYDATLLGTDVIPSETSQVSSVDAQTGALTLAHPVARSFASAVIANVTARATVHVGINHLIVQGSIPIVLEEIFDFKASNCKFITDTTIGGSNSLTGIIPNTVRGMTMDNCVFDSVGPAHTGLELPQRNSQDIVFNNVTFNANSVGFGEYPAHWKITNCHFTIYWNSAANGSCGIGMAGLDIEFSGNDVRTIGNINPSSGWGSVICDLNTNVAYSYFGDVRIMNNTFTGQADGNSCVLLQSRDVIFSGNTINLSGTGTGIHVEYGGVAAVITNNRISVQTGVGILLYTPSVDAVVLANNAFTGSIGSIGIYVASPATPDTGGYQILENTISGFNTPLSIDMSKHPGTVISNTPKASGTLLALTVAPVNVEPGAIVNVSWTDAATVAAGDRIALYNHGDLDSNIIAAQTTGGAPNGTLTFTAPATDGQYEFRYLPSAAKFSIATSNTFVDAAKPPTLTLTTQPQSLTVPAGASATFNVTASGTAPITYQWLQNGTPISGATSASYTIPSTTLDMNGELFQCLVTNPARRVSSNAATLTVTPTVVAVSLYVASISMSLSSTRAGKAATATVKVKDANNALVSGATVSGTWSGLATGGTSIVAAPSAKFVSTRSKKSGQFTFTVTNISKDGCVYDSSLNAATHAWITTSGAVTINSSVSAASTTEAVSLGSVPLDQPFKLALPLPDTATLNSVSAKGSNLPPGVRVSANFLSGRPKKAGTFTTTVRFQWKVASVDSNGKPGVDVTETEQRFVITVSP